jgi:hypothetical protein
LKIEARVQTTSDGLLHPRLYVGMSESRGLESVPDFLKALLGSDLRLNLEVISPYFDETDAAPLRQLLEQFEPREMRVFLPRDADGKALCRDSYFDAVRKLPNTHWGKLPQDLVSGGRSSAATPRVVHAKVYRFFSQNPKYEALFVGSVNLTTAAHSKGGNLETAFLIEPELTRAPDWWLSVESKRPAEFQSAEEEEGLSQRPGTRLVLSYSWETGVAKALWDYSEPSPRLRLQAQGVALF